MRTIFVDVGRCGRFFRDIASVKRYRSKSAYGIFLYFHYQLKSPCMQRFYPLWIEVIYDFTMSNIE